MKDKKIILASLAFMWGMMLPAQNIDVTEGKAEAFSHYWSVGVGAGRVNEGLRAGWLDHLKMVKEHCGFRYVRMHDLFNDDMFVYFEKPDGKVVYNWQYVDEVYDRMLSLGVKPFVELSFFPTGIAAKDSKTQMWYKNKVTVDRNNFGKWHDLILAFTRHVVERYGIDEVRTWYFEVWNEANLHYPGFFDGTKTDYFELYRQAAKAIKAVDSKLKVGGPATSNFVADTRFDGDVYDYGKSVFYTQDKINKQQWKGVWIEDFLHFCEKEGLPVDFVSTHPYPTDYALDPEAGRGKDAIRYVHSLHDDVTWLREVLAKSKYPHAEIHLTEWSTSPNSRDAMHDLLPPAAYIIKANLDCIGLANSLMYWTFTDVFEEKGGGEEAFHGGFGMINFQGIVKPSFHAYRMLNALGDEKLYYKDPLFVSRSSRTGKVTVLAFNYPAEFEEHVPAARDKGTYMNASSKQVEVCLKGFKPGTTFALELLDETHGNAYAAYAAMGKPHSLSHGMVKTLKEAAWGTAKETICADEDGVLRFSRELQPWACLLVTEL